MASSVRGKNTNKQDQNKEKGENLKQLTLTPAKSIAAEANAREAECKIIAELEKLRRENLEGHAQTKLILTNLETSIKEMGDKLKTVENRTAEAEDRISTNEDTIRRHERALRHLLHREMDLTAKCEDMQNRLRRNNLRIYRVPEGREGRDVKAFVKELLQNTLQLPPELNISIERAHRALTAKPKRPTATPRSLIVKFLDYSVKENIIRQAWAQRKVEFEGEQIFFDHDYSPELQNKRASVRSVIKQLKQKNIKAKCLYPAQIKIWKDNGDKTYSTIAEALPALQEFGVHIQVSERERIEAEMSGRRWSHAGGRAKGPHELTHTEIKTFLSADE